MEPQEETQSTESFVIDALISFLRPVSEEVFSSPELERSLSRAYEEALSSPIANMLADQTLGDSQATAIADFLATGKLSTDFFPSRYEQFWHTSFTQVFERRSILLGAAPKWKEQFDYWMFDELRETFHTALRTARVRDFIVSFLTKKATETDLETVLHEDSLRATIRMGFRNATDYEPQLTGTLRSLSYNLSSGLHAALGSIPPESPLMPVVVLGQKTFVDAYLLPVDRQIIKGQAKIIYAPD
ncbi:MAG: hypothetical protein H6502_01965 [Candidatus Woesearchaeota archaeon]|nr:MAG: hypothetical protein H6502_01965 [Candidatus Woesearchaeota archaeon]